MKLSEKRKSALYSAISDTIMRSRIRMAQSSMSEGDKEIVDARLYCLQEEIWREVKAALNMEE